MKTKKKVYKLSKLSKKKDVADRVRKQTFEKETGRNLDKENHGVKKDGLAVLVPSRTTVAKETANKAATKARDRVTASENKKRTKKRKFVTDNTPKAKRK